MELAGLPSVESLRCFLAAAQQLNFRRGAAEVGLTPAAFSQRIKLLEELLECRLFDRSTRHVTLTAAGHELVPRARAALDAVRACRATAEAEHSRVQLSLGTRFELGLSWLVPAVIALRAHRPGWQVDLVFGSGPEIMARLEQGIVDAVVTSAPTASAEWASEVLHPEEYVLVADPELVRVTPLRQPADARAHVLLDIDGDLPLFRYVSSVEVGLEFSDVRRCGTGAAVLGFARAGMGVAVLPRYMIREDLSAGTLVELLPEVTPLRDTFRLIYRRVAPQGEALAEFAQFLRDRPLT